MKWVWAAAALGALLFAAPARASIDVTTFVVAGEPRLWVAEAGTYEVFRCPAGGSCETPALPSTADAWSTTVDVRSAAPGDVFEVRRVVAGQVVETARSPAWTGAPQIAQPAAVTGTLEVGSTISAVPAVWTGGWSGARPRSETKVLACATPSGTGCWWIATESAGTVESRFEGFSVFVTSDYETQTPGSVGDHCCVGRTEPSAGPAYPGFAVVGPIGPIKPAPVLLPPTPNPPTASIRARALRSNGRLSIARVSCPTRCTVELTVTQRWRKTLRSRLDVTGLLALTIAPRHGRLKVTVVVDGKTLASGVSRAR